MASIRILYSTVGTKRAGVLKVPDSGDGYIWGMIESFDMENGTDYCHRIGKIFSVEAVAD